MPQFRRQIFGFLWYFFNFFKLFFQVLRDVTLKRELAIWLDAKLTDIEKRHNLDAKNAALLRTMTIKRLSKFKKGQKDSKNPNSTMLRRAHSEELLSEVGVDNDEGSSSAVLNQSIRSSRSSTKNPRLSDSTGLLQVSDHPRMRHNSADDAEHKYVIFFRILTREV